MSSFFLRITLAVSLLGLAVGPVSAQFLGFDWGLENRNDHEFVTVDGEQQLRSLNTVAVTLEAWQQVGVTTLSYVLSGGFGYSPQLGRLSLDDEREFVAYPGRLSVTATWPPSGREGPWLAGEMGRIPLTDPSGLLLVDPLALTPLQLVDGLGFRFRYPGLYGSVEVGYTGLLDKDVNRVRPTATDRAEAADAGVYFAPRRLLLVMNIQTDSLIPDQSTGLIALVQQDLRGQDTLSAYYLGSVAEGPVMSRFSHRSALIGAFTTSDSGDRGAALLLVPRVSYDIPLGFLGKGWFQVRWASSESRVFRDFPTLAGPTAGTVFREPLSDLVDLQLGVDSLFPAFPRGANVIPALSVTGIFVPSGTSGAETAIDPVGSFGGIETTVSVRYILQEDFSLDIHGAWHFLDRRVRSALGVVGRVEL